MDSERALAIELQDTVIVRDEHLKVISPPKPINWHGERIVRLSALSPLGRTVVLDHNDVQSVIKHRPALPRHHHANQGGRYAA